LAAGEIRGGRDGNGRVSVPPGDGHDLVRLSDVGSLRAWSWVAVPDASHPLATPFAFALIDLDGADTALLHVVDVEREAALRLGLRVRADWRLERRGSILDIRAFVPGERAVPPVPAPPPEVIRVPDERRLAYAFEPGLVPSRFFRALAGGRIEGGRCPACLHVYVPPHDHCPACGSGPMDPVDVASTGTVVSFTVVHLPAPGLDMEVPFGWARIRLDGADVAVPHVVGGDHLSGLAVGQRVQAVWAPEEGRPASWAAIVHFVPVAT
jgi:uncharacterized OB-fold protein